MRIKVMDKTFGIDGLGEIVALHVSDPRSNQIKISEVVNALHIEKKEEGVSKLFQSSIEKFNSTKNEKRLLQLAEGAFRCYTILKPAYPDNEASLREQLQPIIEKHEALFKKIITCDCLQSKGSFEENVAARDVIEERIIDPIQVEIPEAEAWFSTQKLSLAQIVHLADSDDEIKAANQKVTKFTSEHEEKNGLTTVDAKVIHAEKTLYGKPYDQNRLGKRGEKEVVYSNGQKERKPIYAPGFEGFYYAGSYIKMPHRNYLFVQAPLVKHDDKVDTVQDFWDAVVVLEKSPVIVTVHDPKEKIPRHGHPQRAEYWTSDRFEPVMKLRDGWELSRAGDDELIAVSSKYSDEIRLVKRSFIATQQTTNEQHKVTQFHYEGWPDHCGAPDHELLETLHKVVEQELVERKISIDAPITVHCAAGLGRTPTFAISNYLRHELIKRIASGEKIEEITLDIAKTIFEFKKQRPSLLGGDDQWKSVLLALRRVSLEQAGASSDEILFLEKEFEKQVFLKAEEDLQKAIEKREKSQVTIR